MSEFKLRLVEDNTLTAKDMEIAKNELNEDPSTNEEMMEKLFNLMKEKGTTYLTERITDKDNVMAFLRHRKFDLSRAMESIERVTKLIKEFQKIFKFDFEEKRHFFKDGTYGGLKYRDQHGRFIYVIKIGDNFKNLAEFIQLTTMVSTWHVEFIPSQINGVSIIFDMRDFSWAHLVNFFDLSLRTMLITLVQDAFPLRLKEIHFLHPNSVVKNLLKLMNMLLTKKLQKRMIVHEDLSSLHHYISPKILPSEYDGEQPPIDGLELFEKLLKHESKYHKYIDAALRLNQKI